MYKTVQGCRFRRWWLWKLLTYGMWNYVDRSSDAYTEDRGSTFFWSFGKLLSDYSVSVQKWVISNRHIYIYIYITHCSSKWDRPIFLEIKSNENRGTDKLSFAFIVPPKKIRNTQILLLVQYIYKENEVFANSKRRGCVSPCYVCKKHLYFLMAQLIEALRYKPECRGFDSRWGYWHFPLTKFFRPHYGPKFGSVCNTNEHHWVSPGG
jgi:hypothetical protein